METQANLRFSQWHPAIRGREHMIYEKMVELGKATKQINPIGPRNKNKIYYLQESLRTFGAP